VRRRASAAQQRSRVRAWSDPRGKLALDRVVRREVPGNEVRRTGADAVARSTGLRYGDDARVAGQAQIVIAAEVEHLAAIDPQPRTLSGIDDATFAPKTPGGSPFERVIELRGQPGHCRREIRATAKLGDGPTALGDIGDIAARIGAGAIACTEVGTQVGQFGTEARMDTRMDT
jgi:hypothetical protein